MLVTGGLWWEEEDEERERRRRNLFVFIGYFRGTQGARC